MGFRIRKVIAEPGSRLQAYDQDRWAKYLHYEDVDFRKKLNLFTALRQAHLSLIQLLSPKEWKRYGIHEERGKETVARVAEMFAGHDLNHLKQIERLAKG